MRLVKIHKNKWAAHMAEVNQQLGESGILSAKSVYISLNTHLSSLTGLPVFAGSVAAILIYCC